MQWTWSWSVDWSQGFGDLVLQPRSVHWIHDSPIHSFATSTSAMCIVRMCRVAGLRRRMPPMCIRQLMSGETTTSAPLRTMFSTFVLAHRQRRAGHLHAERAAEAAALLDVGQLAVAQAADVLQQRQRRLDHAQLAPGVAAVVQRHLVREAWRRCRSRRARRPGTRSARSTRRPMSTIRGSGSTWPKNTRHMAVHEPDGQTIQRYGSNTSQKWWITCRASSQ